MAINYSFVHSIFSYAATIKIKKDYDVLQIKAPFRGLGVKCRQALGVKSPLQGVWGHRP